MTHSSHIWEDLNTSLELRSVGQGRGSTNQVELGAQSPHKVEHFWTQRCCRGVVKASWSPPGGGLQYSLVLKVTNAERFFSFGLCCCQRRLPGEINYSGKNCQFTSLPHRLLVCLFFLFWQESKQICFQNEMTFVFLSNYWSYCIVH